MTDQLTIGIDAANLRGGGGITHLIELLSAVEPLKHGISRVIVWGSEKTLATVEDKFWLVKRSPSALNRGLLLRSIWQHFALSKLAKAEGCDLLFVPGGSFSGNFHPVVTMSRNLLPFEWRELKRFGWSITTLRLLILKHTQSRTFQRCDGVIFLTDYAKDTVLAITGQLRGKVITVPHGVSSRFFEPPRLQQSINHYSSTRPFRLLYVSIIDQYKHQWYVVEAVAILRQKYKWPLILDLVGPSYPPALHRLKVTLRSYDPDARWVRYQGSLPYNELHRFYTQADIGLFASSCENMPNILLETMAAGLPIASSNRGPMPEILKEAGVYFDPEDPKEIASALESLIVNPELRARLARASYSAAKQYTWHLCAEQTLNFLSSFHNKKIGRGGTCAA